MKRYIPALFILSAPLVAFAAPADFKEFIELLLRLLANAVSILFASLVIGLMYGIALYMMNGDNESKREEIKPYLLWAVIGIAVVLGMWGLVGILSATFFDGVIGIPFLSPPT